jgi:predicted ATPase
LHPEWQSVLSEVLVKLASNCVNIIITTHSSDMLKALEFNTENDEKFNSDALISTNYFNSNGKLLNLEGNGAIEKIASARAELLKPYNALSIRKSPFND